MHFFCSLPIINKIHVYCIVFSKYKISWKVEQWNSYSWCLVDRQDRQNEGLTGSLLWPEEAKGRNHRLFTNYTDDLVQGCRISIANALEILQTCTKPFMMTSSNGNIFRVTGPLCGEFTSPSEFPTQRPVTRGFDFFFDLRLNKRLSKQPWGWWFETPLWSLWRHCNRYFIEK